MKSPAATCSIPNPKFENPKYDVVGFQVAAYDPNKRLVIDPVLEYSLIGEAVTNLYVGLQRDKRGEKLSAMRFIQGYAVDRLLELAEHMEAGNTTQRDPFVNERRFEQRFPGLIPHLRTWAQGYDKNPDSALAILDFLERHFEVNQAMVKEIRDLCK